jgi:hypothetical protein
MGAQMLDKGLGELGFWLAVGMVIAAMIVSGAIKERDRERDRQAMLRLDWEKKQALRQTLLENAGGNIAEVLAYLRERDAAAAAKGAEAMARMDEEARRKRMKEPRVFAVVGAFILASFAFMGGLIALGALTQHPQVQRFTRFEYSAQAGRVVPVPPPPPVPPPTGWDAFAPVGVMFAIWAAGLLIAALIVILAYRKPKNEPQADA